MDFNRSRFSRYEIRLPMTSRTTRLTVANKNSILYLSLSFIFIHKPGLLIKIFGYEYLKYIKIPNLMRSGHHMKYVVMLISYDTILKSKEVNNFIKMREYDLNHKVLDFLYRWFCFRFSASGNSHYHIDVI